MVIASLTASALASNIATTAVSSQAMAAISRQSLMALKRLEENTKRSSNMLGSVFKMFGRSMTLFFRPFANFLGRLLRPMARALLTAAKLWNQIGPRIIEALVGIALPMFSEESIKAISDFSTWLGQFVTGTIPDFGVWLGNFIVGTISNFGTWLSNFIITPISKLGEWLGEFISGNITDFGDWLKQFIFSPITDFGTWLKQFITGGIAGIGAGARPTPYTPVTGTATTGAPFVLIMPTEEEISKMTVEEAVRIASELAEREGKMRGWI